MNKKVVLSALTCAILLGGCSIKETIGKFIANKINHDDGELMALADYMKTKDQVLPEIQQPETVVYVDQGWDKKTKDTFWNIPQGTFLMPYNWFLSLERPNGEADSTGKLLSDRSYMERFGFISAPYKTESNPGNLPIGFGYNDKFNIPYNEKEIEGNALYNYMNKYKTPTAEISCAACHTGMIEHKGKGLLLEGGPAMTDIILFQDKLGATILEMTLDSSKLDRFAERVHALKPKEASTEEIKTAFNAYTALSKASSLTMAKERIETFREGFGRLDALTRIGNIVFGKDLNISENYRAIRGPVNYPYIWTVPWFDWAQYNGSIRQPMVRNVGEVLGVQALLNITSKEMLFHSSVRVDNLKKVEDDLTGKEKLGGLSAPEYEEAAKLLDMPAIDSTLASKGKTLYNDLCKKCHMPPVGSDEIMEKKYWTAPNEWNRQYLKTHNIPLDVIGTDPMAATDFFERRADSGNLGLGVIGADTGLWKVVGETAKAYYKSHNIPESEWAEWDGYRKNVVLRPLGYRTRPLNGTWATPPYLHNGSVPNLYELLSPYEERSEKFYLGSKKFDPKKLGLDTRKFTGGFLMDTTLPGNANTGHLFSNAKTTNSMKPEAKAQGIIGRELSKDERYAIIEYIKTL